MKSVAQKIFISLGFITLITLSVIPVSVGAQADGIGGAPETTNDTKLPTPTVAGTIGALADGATILLSPILVPLFYTIMSLVSGLLGISGLLLDYIITISVVELTENIKGITAINNTWKVIRDLANMSFIFILLYQGIRMVLGLGDGKNSVQNVVKNIIVAAILVNFSLFFTKIIIDASNIVTLGFYKSIVSSGTGEVIPGYETNFGLTGALMKALRLSSLYTLSAFGNAFISGTKTLVIFSGNIIFMLIAAFVFLAVAVMFIIRYISFILLLIMSPIAFVAMAIPGLDTLKDKYVKTLTSQALFAPVFMLLTWVLLTLAGDSGFLKSSITASLGDATATPNKDTISLVFEYILIIGMLIQTLVLSKSVSARGGIISTKLVDQATGYLGGAVFGAGARMGTQTLGRAGRAIADSDTLRERVEKGGVTGKLAKWTLQGARTTADSSFDVRNLGVVGGDLAKVGAGKGIRGGYDSYLKEKKKEDKELLELIKPSDRAVAQAEERLKSDEFKEWERNERDKYFASPERVKEVADERAKRQKALNTAIADKLRAQTSLTAAQAELVSVTNDIERSAAYIDLQTQLTAATTDADREAIRARINEKRKPIEDVVAKVSTSKNLAKQKDAAFDKATKDLDENFEKWQTAGYESWISEIQKGLIATKGGQDEKKYGKENPDLRGQIKTREVLPQSDIRAKAIAERVGGQKSAWMPWMYFNESVPEFNKDRARAYKKGLKKKKSVEEELKAIAKEEADNSDDAAPAAAPATPPATPPVI